LIIPAYMQAQTVQTPGMQVDYSEIVLSTSLMAVLAIIGFTKDKYRRSKDQRG